MRTIIFAVLAPAACAAPPPTSSEPPASALVEQIRADLARLDAELAADGIVSAGFNETANLGGGLTIRPLDVIEDSRCPANVECVWAGRLRLRADVSGTPAEFTLGEPLTTPHGVVLLAVAKPAPWHDWPSAELPVPPYRFGFRRG